MSFSNEIKVRGRIMYPHLHTPHQFRDDRNDPDKEPKFSATIVVDPSNDAIPAINAESQQLIASDLDGVQPTPGNMALKAGSNENVTGMLELRAWSKQEQKPVVVDKNLKPILDSSKPADGDWCWFSIQLFSYNTRGNKGIGVWLNGVMHDAAGEGRLAKSGPASPEQMFGGVADSQPAAATDPSNPFGG